MPPSRLKLPLFLLLLASLPGCDRAPRTPQEAQPAASAGQSIRITDGLGRTVELRQPAQRIVSLAPSCTEILFAIGAGPQVVGVTSFSDYPPQATRLPQVGGLSRETINVEHIVGLEPDLICAAGTLQGDLIEDLRGLGLNVVAFEPLSINDILADIRTAGRLTGRDADAQRVVKDIEGELADIDAHIAKIPADERPRVFYEVWYRPLRTASAQSYLGELIARAGGRNIFADLTEAYPLVSEEAVVQFSPEVILAVNHEQADVEQFRSRSAWQSVTAIRQGRITFLDENLVSRPGPRVAEALRHVAAALHSDRFAAARPAAQEPDK